MSDWAKKMSDKLRNREADQTRTDAYQAVKRQAGPPLWAAVRSDVMAQGKALNTEMGEGVISMEANTATQLGLVATLKSGVRRILVEFDPETGEMSWKTRNGVEKFVVHWSQDTAPAFHGGMLPVYDWYARQANP